MDFSHAVTTLRDVPVLRLAGSVDLESAPQVAARLTELVQDAAGRVVVDLTEVSFFDSSGLSALDEGQTAAAARGTSIALICLDSRILRLFDITGLADRFVISQTAEQAIQQ